MRSEAEIADIKWQVIAEQAAIYPDHDIMVGVNKFNPPLNGSPDWIVTWTPKSWSDD